MAFKRIVALVPWLLATLASAFGVLHPAPQTAPGDFFYNNTDNTGADSSGTRNLCRENGWLNYDTTSGYRVAANIPAPGAAPIRTPAPIPGGAGPYSQVRGHHVHGKAAFRVHPSYNPKQGFSISQDFMSSRGWSHTDMTRAQRRLFDELAQSSRPNTLREHTRIAVEAMIEGGATRADARSIVAHSLLNLRAQGVRVPTRIPWN